MTESEWIASIDKATQPLGTYVYVGAGLQQTNMAKTLVIYEKFENHAGGGHALYLDGTVVWLDILALQRAIDGIRPTTRPGG
jgi:hypothetical protein